MCEKITCPICNEKLNSLNTHIFYKHNLTVEEFKNTYGSDYPLQKEIEFSEPCPYCNKIYKRRCNFKFHLKQEHPEHFNKECKTENEFGHECKICFKKIVNFKQHIEMSHKMFWDEYCLKYNWDVSHTKYISEE